MISVTFDNETADGLIADLQRVFPALLAGTALPPMVEQPSREPAPEPARRGRKMKEDAKADAGESSASANTSPSDAPASTASQTSVASTENRKPGGEIAAEIPDIELVRAKLKQLGATDGLGHDKVFEVLGRYKATNASSVPTEKRAELIAEIDGLLKGAAK